MKIRARTAAIVVALALSACGPHRDPTTAPPSEGARNHHFTTRATERMHDEQYWFAPSRCKSIGAVALPFARYLNQLHAKLHPVFASQALAWMDTLPKSHALQEQSLATVVGLVIRGRDGQVVRRVVLRSSGSTFFDVSALDAIDRSAPFDAAPSAISSPDGNVYIQWELRRDKMACSTSQAHPYLLK